MLSALHEKKVAKFRPRRVSSPAPSPCWALTLDFQSQSHEKQTTHTRPFLMTALVDCPPGRRPGTPVAAVGTRDDSGQTPLYSGS